MSATKHGLSDLATLGADIYDRQVRPTLRPEDDGKFVAIDVDTEDFEVNADDYTAVSRLRSRKPAAEAWLKRVDFRPLAESERQDDARRCQRFAAVISVALQ